MTSTQGIETMMVSELIEKLTALPPDAPVLVADWNEQYAPPALLTTVAYHEATHSVVLEDVL